MDDFPNLLFGMGTALPPFLVDALAFALTPWPLLLLGPSGSGKTVLARYLHARSLRAGAAFVDCALTAISDELRIGALLGYQKGAFTGAVRDHRGYFESAHGGTLFLDEVGWASQPLQTSLLGVLEDRSVRRLGSERSIPVDVRLMFATAADLDELRQQGRFLDELYWRLGGLQLRLPALSERRDDILPLARRFLHEQLATLRRPFRPSFSREAGRCMQDALWPGNIRQLQSECTRLAALTTSDREIQVEDLSSSVVGPQAVARLRDDPGLRLAHVMSVLAEVGGNKKLAAKRLGVSLRTLYRYLEGDDGERLGASA